MDNKKILVVGTSYPLVKRLKLYSDKIIAAPGNDEIKKIAECVDIRENNVEELLEYAVKNDIDLTVVASDSALSSDIASYFQANEKVVFAPSLAAAEYVLNKSQAKRLLYKLHASTPKFGIFEKQQLAFDYLKDAAYPLVISADRYNSDKYFCTTPERAKFHAEDLFTLGEAKIIIEDYVYGHEFSLYFVSDGYHVLPLSSVRNFKFTENGDGGILTTGMGSYCPDDKVSADLIDDIMENIVVKALNYLEKGGNAYCGILGLDVVLTNNGYSVLNFKPFMQDSDIQCVLNSIDENLLDLFEACANGFFADEYEDILTNGLTSVSCVAKTKSNCNLDLNDDRISSDVYIANNKVVFTSSANTLSRAKKKLAEDIDVIGVDKLKLRTDIFNS